MGIIKFFLILFLIFFLLGYIARFMLRLFFKRVEKNFNSQNAQGHQRPEGDVYVNKGQQKGKIVDKNIGDYVDYEEVKE
jgi:hypothetical protein